MSRLEPPPRGLTVKRLCDSVRPDMATNVIIDGYNVLGVRGWTVLSSSKDIEQFREQLIQDLSHYWHLKGHPITLVFDAWRAPHSEHREHRSGVEVIYTRRGERADQVVQQMTRQFGQDCVVVSSDLEIVATAKAHSALTISAQEFQCRLEIALHNKQAGKNVRLHSDSAAYGKVDDIPIVRRPDKKGNPRKLPKSQRNRNRQLRGF